MYKSFLRLFVLILGPAALLIIGCLNVAQEPLTSVAIRDADPVMPKFVTTAVAARDSRLTARS